MRLYTLAILLAAPALAAAPAPLVLDDVTWSVSRRDRDTPRLTVSRGSTNSSGFDLDRPTPEARALTRAAAGPVSFVLDREAGSLDCGGTLAGAGGSGRCRFTSRPAFEERLAERGIAVERRDRLLSLALVDARIERLDGLARAGLTLRTADELIAATALAVDADYALGLQSGGLRIRSIQDLVACRALGIDAAYVRGLVQAGYRGLDARRVIAIKAVGVTPEYARSMNRAARGAGVQR